MDTFPAAFERTIGKTLRQNVVLGEHSSFGIGGKARYFFEAGDLAEIKSAIGLCRSLSLPYYLIGSATNILFDDAGFNGLIIKNACAAITPRPGGEVESLSGTRLSSLVEFAARAGLAGMEFLAGIPGTVGGAVFGNAGAFGRSIGDILTRAVLFDGQGREMTVPAGYFRFSYRRSRLREEHLILLSAVFRLEPGSEAAIRARISENLGQRRRNNPPGNTACAGCYFKNPILKDGSKVSAGKVLEEAGAKTVKSGDASVSSRHGNFIINEGRATAADVLKLAAELKKRVRERFGYELEEEVIYLPADASMP